MQRNFLFVGGIKDGEFLALPNPANPEPVIEIAVLDKTRGEETETVSYNREKYHRETLRATQDYLLYRHESLTIDDVIRRLLEHYKPEAI